MTLPWKHPFTAIVAGPTGSGKSYFVFNFLKHLDTMLDQPVEEVVWCFGTDQVLYDEIKKSISVPTRFVQGLPSLMDIAPEKKPKARLVIVDDLMRESDKHMVDLFTKGSHHSNLSIVFISQNIFHQGRGQRDISLNAHYIVFFKNPRDQYQIVPFSRQVYPENPKFVQEAYKDATSS